VISDMNLLLSYAVKAVAVTTAALYFVGEKCSHMFGIYVRITLHSDVLTTLIIMINYW
jgi:hypothetical protein